MAELITKGFNMVHATIPQNDTAKCVHYAKRVLEKIGARVTFIKSPTPLGNCLGMVIYNTLCRITAPGYKTILLSNTDTCDMRTTIDMTREEIEGAGIAECFTRRDYTLCAAYDYAMLEWNL